MHIYINITSTYPRTPPRSAVVRGSFSAFLRDPAPPPPVEPPTGRPFAEKMATLARGYLENK